MNGDDPGGVGRSHELGVVGDQFVGDDTERDSQMQGGVGPQPTRKRPGGEQVTAGEIDQPESAQDDSDRVEVEIVRAPVGGTANRLRVAKSLRQSARCWSPAPSPRPRRREESHRCCCASPGG